MSIFHDVPTPLSFANKKNKMELVKIVKDVPKDIIDGTGVVPADGPGRFKKQKRNAQIQPRPPFHSTGLLWMILRKIILSLLKKIFVPRFYMLLKDWHMRKFIQLEGLLGRSIFLHKLETTRTKPLH